MINPADLESLLKQSFTDARIMMMDKTGQSDHFILTVISDDFEGQGIMDRHRAVMDALKPVYESGQLHAAEITTATSAEAG